LKILFLANRVPYPPFRGDKLKIFNLAQRLCGDHELHLLTFAQTEQDLTYKTELEKIFKEVQFIYLPKKQSALNCLSALWNPLPVQVLYFQSRALKSALSIKLKENKYDAVHVQHLRMAPYLEHETSVPRILDLPDAFSLYWERRKKIKKNKLLAIFEFYEQKRLVKYEAVIRNYNMSLVCSSEDLTYLQRLHGANNLNLLPNGVDLKTFAPRNHDYSHCSTLLFTGNMDYAPNVDAVIYFVETLLPLIRQHYPTIKFVIAGNRPVKKVLALASDHVIVTGFVKDLAATYNEASVVVAPLRFGAGTQNKVLEAMAMGVPVVCSHIGFNGLGIANGEGAYMETTPEGFVSRVLELLSSEEKRSRLGNKGLQLVRDHFDWDIIAKRLEHYLLEVSSQNTR
jgi:polysaccharide biosynthesis protein PslH